MSTVFGCRSGLLTVWFRSLEIIYLTQRDRSFGNELLGRDDPVPEGQRSFAVDVYEQPSAPSTLVRTPLAVNSHFCHSKLRSTRDVSTFRFFRDPFASEFFCCFASKPHVDDPIQLALAPFPRGAGSCSTKHNQS